MFTLQIQTGDGHFLGEYSEEGLAQLRFPSGELFHDSTAPGFVQDWHSLTSAAVLAILAGRVPNLLPPVDLSSHTSFQRSVWHQLGQIPLGEALSYAEVAQRIGNPGATRAVGGACGANPIPLIIPCHRVLGAKRTLGGFSGGLNWKRKLLAIEGIDVKERSNRAVCRTAHQQELAFAASAPDI